MLTASMLSDINMARCCWNRRPGRNLSCCSGYPASENSSRHPNPSRTCECSYVDRILTTGLKSVGCHAFSRKVLKTYCTMIQAGHQYTKHCCTRGEQFKCQTNFVSTFPAFNHWTATCVCEIFYPIQVPATALASCYHTMFLCWSGDTRMSKRLKVLRPWWVCFASWNLKRPRQWLYNFSFRNPKH